LGTSFALSSLGDDVYLFSGNAAQELTGYSHGFDFGGAQTGVSFGRQVNSVGDEHFPAQTARTPGANNSGPRVGPVVINEIHYNPVPGGDEFVELLNLSGGTVPLFDPASPTNRWGLSGFGFNFPANVSLAPGELLLVVSGDPSAFRAKYNVPAAVQVLGPTTGNLQGSGERLELQAPDAPTTNGVPYFNVDDVRYNDRLPGRARRTAAALPFSGWWPALMATSRRTGREPSQRPARCCLPARGQSSPASRRTAPSSPDSPAHSRCPLPVPGRCSTNGVPAPTGLMERPTAR
jgi:hypothetical protein